MNQATRTLLHDALLALKDGATPKQRTETARLIQQALDGVEYTSAFDGAHVVVTRTSDGKTIAFGRESFGGEQNARKAAIAIARRQPDHVWG